jgi:hypothetical protein
MRTLVDTDPARVGTEPAMLDERLAALVQAGEITLPRRKQAPMRGQPARVRGRPVAETVLKDRD